MPFEMRFLENRDDGLAFIKYGVEGRLRAILVLFKLVGLVKNGCLKERGRRKLVGVTCNNDGAGPKNEGMASGVGSWEASSKMTKSKLQLPGFRNVDTEIGLMSKQGLSACRTLGVSAKSLRSGLNLFFF